MAGTTNTGEVRPQGRYVLGELLGRGGMAKVFAGHAVGSHGFQKPVAIKRLLPELATDHVFVERLIGEAKLLVGMQHGNVVSVLDLCRDGDDVLLVMEFVDGPTLRGLLKARGGRMLSHGAATYVVQAAAAGLEFAHTRRVIHADISPSNLLLTTSGEVRVADFGIARREGVGTGIVEGKWAYMAPEQARGEALTPRCDVFALGVVLYELIAGCHPFGQQITADQRASQPLHVMSPRSIRSDIPVGLDAICMRALADDPRARYARMQDMIDALVDERFANGWREGASELAQVIRDATLGVAPTEQRTQADVVMTINTRSLIIEPPSRSPLPRMRFAEGTRPPQNVTRASSVVEMIARGSAPSLVDPQSETQRPPSKWPVMLFGGAALVGAVAAIALRVAPSAHEAPPAAQVLAHDPEPTVTPIVAAVPPAPPVAAPEPTPPPVAPAIHTAPRPHVAAPPAKHETSTLRVRTSDGAWATVTIAGQPRQETPGAQFHLAPGHYAIKLENDQDGVRRCSITLEAGHNATLAVDMQRRSDACWVE